MAQSNFNRRPSKLAKRGELWGSHGYLHPKSPMYSSVIEAFEAARRERRGK